MTSIELLSPELNSGWSNPTVKYSFDRSPVLILVMDLPQSRDPSYSIHSGMIVTDKPLLFSRSHPEILFGHWHRPTSWSIIPAIP